jgi:hypothetical protein
VTDATLTAAEGLGEVRIEDRGILGVPRSLYLYENRGVQALSVQARSLYLYENKGFINSLLARALYLYANRAIQALTPLARSLYLYEARRDGEVSPWLMKIDPVEQYAGGQVDLYGDGFGEIVEVAAGAAIAVDSTNGANVAANAIDRLASTVWASNGGAAAWIRFTFGAPKTIVAIALEGSGASWGVPEFRFSDGGANINGGTAVPAGAPVGTEYPVGTSRILYALPAPRTTTYVEVRIASGGSGTRGLYEVWIYEDLDDLAETSRVWLNFGQPAVTDLGIVLWANRSPNLYPANSGVPIAKAATVTLPAAATSGLVIVREET